MHRCWLKGSEGDALNAVLSAVGYNLRWLLRAILRLGLGPVLLRRWLTAWCTRWRSLIGAQVENWTTVRA
jgi:transposase, IS5 family